MAQFIYERFELFKSQNQENGHFDLKFEIEGKIIYAHKFMLGSVSDVLKRMISETWNKKESIPITTSSYEDFYEFLTFLYSGNCVLYDKNIFTMVDLSEFYHVKSLQQKCDKYLSQKEYTSKNVFMFFQKLVNYSLPLFENAISIFLKEKRINLVESEGFLESSKEMIKKIVCFKDRIVSEENFFEKVYEWAEVRAMKKREESSVENFNMKNAIKAETSEFLPFIEFKKMNSSFLHKFVVQRGFLFTYDELRDILENAKPDIKVKVTNANRKSIYCWLPSHSDVIDNVKTLKGFPSADYTRHYVFWKKAFTKPSNPSPLIIRDGVEWYLIYLEHGQMGVINHASIVESDYLISEMIAETSSFKCTKNCKIEIE